MTLKLHDLPQFFGTAVFDVKAASAEAYRRLLREFVSFYRDHLFNHQWGGRARLQPDNALDIEMLAHGMDTGQVRDVWKPFLDWVNRSSGYSVKSPVAIGSMPARHYWDAQWWKEHWPEITFPRNGWMHRLLDDVLVALLPEPGFNLDDRPGAGVDDFWWKGDGVQVAWFIWGLESLWLPATLLEESAQQGLADAMFAASRHSGFEIQFDKGLAAAPPEAIAAARDTATNPAVLTAFALAIAGNAQGPAYPGIPGHEPSVVAGRMAASRVDQCMSQLRALVPNGGAYVSESNYFQKDFQQAYWGSNYTRLAQIKQKYDPDGLFIVHNGVGSDQWSTDGFTRL